MECKYQKAANALRGTMRKLRCEALLLRDHGFITEYECIEIYKKIDAYYNPMVSALLKEGVKVSIETAV